MIYVIKVYIYLERMVHAGGSVGNCSDIILISWQIYWLIHLCCVVYICNFNNSNYWKICFCCRLDFNPLEMEYIIDTIEGGKFECKLCEKVRSTTQIKGHLTETYDIKPVANVFWQALKRSINFFQNLTAI